MTSGDWITREAPRAVERLQTRLAPRFNGRPRRRRDFFRRLETHGERLFRLIHRLYGWRWDFAWQLERLVEVAAEAALARPSPIRRLDAAREESGIEWFGDPRVLWGMGYVDRFAGDLAGVGKRIEYLTELGVTHLHLMPLYAVPEGPNDGGYAVSDYRRVRPDLGTMEDLEALAERLREHGIALALDLVLNHTAHDHPWALKARQGDPRYQDYYLMFDDRTLPDRFVPHLREIFPERGGDAFTWVPGIPGPAGGKWVWTTFYPFQWDLNYANPEVLAAMAGEMLFLANRGVEVLRMDATPFLWKREGTSCENLEEAHLVLQALNAVAAIAAPFLVFLSEAIVHPDDVVRFVAPQECPLAYNPLLMASEWEAAATRDTTLLRHALAHRTALPEGSQWLTYLRSHDDIGWGFADEDAISHGIDPAGHRSFLNSFYSGAHPASFARGMLFQENPVTGDARISGTLASLAGLEAALEAGDPVLVDQAVRRILALLSVVATAGGLPLLYLGDELGQLNDYRWPTHSPGADDNRWLHRPFFPWEEVPTASEGMGASGRIRAGLLRLLEFRRRHPSLATTEVEVLPLRSRELLGYRKRHHDDEVLVVVNFSERSVGLGAGELPPRSWVDPEGQPVAWDTTRLLDGYQVVMATRSDIR